MKKFKLLLILPNIFLYSVLLVGNSDYYLFESNYIHIKMSNNWIMTDKRPIDSHEREFINGNKTIRFSYGEQGYLPKLLLTEKEYLNTEYLWFNKVKYKLPKECFDQVKLDPVKDAEIIKTMGQDYHIVIKKYKMEVIKNENNPNYKYYARFIFDNKTFEFPIKIPIEIAKHNIKEYILEDKYKIKIISPKEDYEDTMFGIYINALNSNFEFEISTNNMFLNDKDEILKIFRSIEIKKYNIHLNNVSFK